MGVPEAWGLTPAASNEDLGTGLPGQTSRRLASGRVIPTSEVHASFPGPGEEHS